MLKKPMVALMTLVLFAGAAMPATACPRRHSNHKRAQYSRHARESQVNRYNNSRRRYYTNNQPRKRSFWQKHRDKLTVAAGTGGGALIGGLVGGKKGALIGALAGGGGSALYTYKIRNRNRRY